MGVASGGPFDLTGTSPSVSDDGLPNPPATLTTVWTQKSGPGPVIFGDPSVVGTNATFPCTFVDLVESNVTANPFAVATLTSFTTNATVRLALK